MNVEYEEFENIEDLLLYLSSVAPPMKNFMPINSYKGFICSFISTLNSSLFSISEKNQFNFDCGKRKVVSKIVISKNSLIFKCTKKYSLRKLLKNFYTLIYQMCMIR